MRKKKCISYLDYTDWKKAENKLNIFNFDILLFKKLKFIIQFYKKKN
jgi:hypothetical protein